MAKDYVHELPFAIISWLSVMAQNQHSIPDFKPNPSNAIGYPCTP